jgi:hypothetical protein
MSVRTLTQVALALVIGACGVLGPIIVGLTFVG